MGQAFEGGRQEGGLPKREVTSASGGASGDEPTRDTLIAVLVEAVKGAGRSGLKLKDLPGAVDKTIRTWSDIKQRRVLTGLKAEIVEQLIDSDFLGSDLESVAYDEDEQKLALV